MKALSKWFAKYFGGKSMTKRDRILNLFFNNIGREFSSSNLHSTFGSSFRSRVSDINRDPSVGIAIKNRTIKTGESWYKAEWRPVVF